MNETMMHATVMAKIIFTSILGIFGWVLTYTSIDKEVFAIFTVLLLLDYVTGVNKAYVTKESITSNKMKYGILSKLSLILIPIVMALGAKALGQDYTTLFSWGMNLLILSEVYSVVGNIYTIRSGQALPEWDVIAIFGKKIRENMMSRDKD